MKRTRSLDRSLSLSLNLSKRGKKRPPEEEEKKEEALPLVVAVGRQQDRQGISVKKKNKSTRAAPRLLFDTPPHSPVHA